MIMKYTKQMKFCHQNFLPVYLQKSYQNCYNFKNFFINLKNHSTVFCFK